MKIWTRLAGLAGLMLMLTGCYGTVTTSTNYGGNYYYRTGWYDVYGRYCSGGYPTAGCNFYANGAKIQAYDDPYYYGYNTMYYDYWTYTDSYGYYRSYWGYAWLSPTGILYDQFGYALNEQDTTEVSADVIAAAAKQEKEVAIRVGKDFAQRHALAEDKGILISQTLQDWAILARDRVRTDADAEATARKLFGVNPAKANAMIEKAVQTASLKPLEDLNADIAAYWGTTPETSKEILKQWYSKELSVFGAK
jgi:hypothetical protein